jgi:hypothetical protein
MDMSYALDDSSFLDGQECNAKYLIAGTGKLDDIWSVFINE